MTLLADVDRTIRMARRWPHGLEWWAPAGLGGLGERARLWRWGVAPWNCPGEKQ